MQDTAQQANDPYGFKIFTGNSNPVFANKVCEYLGKSIGNAKVNRFSDGEIQIEIKENVRSKEVFIIQATCAPVNDNLMELLLMADALKRSSASKITAVIPYFGYARQDKKVTPRVPISAKVVADLIENIGIARVITMDLHASQIQGFFNIPVDNLYAAPVIIQYIKETFNMDDVIIVSPDAGGVERARAFAKRLKVGLSIIDKRRDAPNVAKAMAVIGNVTGKTAIILDDMVDTAGTLCEAAQALLENGAKTVHCCCSHPVLSGPAIDRMNASGISSLVVTDTIPIQDKAAMCDKLKVLSIAEIVGEGMLRSFQGKSVSSLFI